jgi:hypothetical protein
VESINNIVSINAEGVTLLTIIVRNVMRENKIRKKQEKYLYTRYKFGEIIPLHLYNVNLHTLKFS